MSAWTCEQVEPLIDLYAADECDAPVRSAVERHLTACAACRDSSHQARQLLGLLDQRFQESERLKRLWTRLGAEPRGARRATPMMVWRLAAVAAAILAAFGLTAWVGPETEPAPGVQLTARLRPPLERAAPMAMVVRNDFPSKVAAPAARQTTDAASAPIFSLDLGGKTPAEFRRGLRGADALPPPPAVHLVLEIHNGGRDALPLAFGEEGAELSLDLRGPGAISVPAPGASPPWPDLGVVRLAPGDTLRLPIHRLAFGSRGAVRYAYWTEPGEYTLTVTLRARTGTSALAGAPEVVTTTGPITLRVVGQ